MESMLPNMNESVDVRPNCEALEDVEVWRLSERISRPSHILTLNELSVVIRDALLGMRNVNKNDSIL